MKLNYITLMVRDIEKSMDFYKNLVELKVLKQFNLGAGKIAFLGNTEGETMLELIEFDNAEKVSIKGMVMSFLSDTEIEKLRDKAIKLGYFPSEIIDNAPKPKHFTVVDPDGIIVEFSN